jgi:pimeloyl-ACP methyl ester carboxylesterase
MVAATATLGGRLPAIEPMIFVQDTLSVLDAVGIKTAVLVGISDGAKWGIQMAAGHADRVSDLVLIGPSTRHCGSQRKVLQSFFSEPVDRDGWNKCNAVYWQRDYRGVLEFFCSQVISQPHSAKQVEDQIKSGLETTPEARNGHEDTKNAPRHRKDQRVAVASVGGTGVGHALLQRIIDSCQEARRRIPALRLDRGRQTAASTPSHSDAMARLTSAAMCRTCTSYLAVSELGLVQAGVSTTIELVATRRPFLYFPVHDHFEQTFHVPGRLANYVVQPGAKL